MAKDWEKKFKKMDPYEKMRAMNKMGEFYGVEGVGPGSRSGSQGRSGARYGSQHENTGGRVRNHEDVQRDINDAMASGGTSDYLRYTGNRGLPHANDRAGMYALHKEMEKAHKKNPDGDSGGAFNNLSDIHGLTQKAFADWEQGLLDKIGKGSEETAPVEEETPEPQNMSWNQAVESGILSPRIQSAIDRQENNDYPAYSIYKATTNTPEDTPASDAQKYLKAEVKKIAADQGKITKSKQTEQAYTGMFGTMGMS